MKKVLLLASLLVALAASPALAVPSTMNFTGRLTTSTGPVTGNVSVTFRLFSTVTGGTAVWTENHPTVTADMGLVYVDLGSTTALDETVFDGTVMYLELVVNGETLSPRMPINAVPYAFRTIEAETAANAASVGTLNTNSIVTNVTAGSGMAASITNNGLSVGLTTSCAPNQLLKYVSNNWTCQNDVDTPPVAGNGIAVNNHTVSLATTNCLNGFVWKFSSSTNTFTCAADADTPPTGSAPIAVSGSRVVSLTNCGANQVYKMNAGGTAWGCAADANTTYTNGVGISITGTTIAADLNTVQRRVTGTCLEGQAIRFINADGTATCQAVGAGTTIRFTSLATGAVDVTTTLTQLNIGTRTFTKQRADSNVELILQSRISSGTFNNGATAILYQLRVDGSPTTLTTIPRTFASNTLEYVTIHAVFTGLTAGNHTVTVWASTNAGGSQGVFVDPGNWGGSILVKEY